MAGDPGDDPRARFDSIRQVNLYGEEYWSARDLMPLLGYDKWERFDGVIERAKAACRNLGQDDADHFPGSGKVITGGKGAKQEVKDYLLSRLACYLVAMNGDARKPEIAAAQGYFAAQTRRMEQWDELRAEVQERLELRHQLADSNKQFTAVAQQHGVNSRSFGRIFNAGALGLYGMTIQEVKAHKGVGEREDLNDRMGRRELSANIFVRSLTTDKVENEDLRGAGAIADAHHEVGSETRALITRLGGTKPEDLPAEPSIRLLLDQQSRRRKPVAEPQQPALLESGSSDDE
jgi:DNA-damage-inducible protein D